MSILLKFIGILIVGALGALIFNIFLLPFLLASPYFENMLFVKNFKEGRILVNKVEQVYIQENASIESAIERIKNSVVTIQGKTIVSGLIATSDGSIITLANAIPSSGNAKVFLAGEPIDFKVVKMDYQNNLALLKIDKNNLQTIGFADYGKIRLGQKVFLLASTSIKQDNWIANEGIIREVNGDIISTNIIEKRIVSGGPLFNSAGELIGLNFINPEGKISVISINTIRHLLGL